MNNNSVHCLKCKKVTKTKNAQVVQSKNGRYRIAGTCATCGTKKSKFISSQQGQGLLGKLLGMPDGRIPGLSSIPLLGPLLF